MNPYYKFKAWQPFEGYQTIAIADDFDAIMWGLEHQIDIFTQDDKLVYSPNDDESSNFERLAKYGVRCIDDAKGRSWERIEGANEAKLMDLKNMKIFIPEIPKEWKQRSRAGHTNIWNDSSYQNGLPEIKLEPPHLGLYAERFEDGWYWICGCSKCLKNNEPYPYIVCDEHNRCVTCNTHRNELTEAPWGHRNGFQCKSCHKREHKERKRTALREARKNGHSEDDCYYTRTIICPRCATECSEDDIHEPGEHEITCDVCDTEFIVEVDYEVSYTSTLKNKH